MELTSSSVLQDLISRVVLKYVLSSAVKWLQTYSTRTGAIALNMVILDLQHVLSNFVL